MLVLVVAVVVVVVSSSSLRELALAYRRKYRMSCAHARVGSFGAITRVCEIGWGGSFPPPGSTWVHLRPPSPNFDVFR